jgi:hypothetical protein
MLEKICTDLETSKRLKELGFDDSESEFVYWKGKPEYYHNLPFFEIDRIQDLITCYTLEQILKELPKSFNSGAWRYNLNFDYTEECIEYKSISDEPYIEDRILIWELRDIADNFATTAAKLWIQLKNYEII